MKIIHCADIHLGSKMKTNLNSEKAALRKAEIFDTFLSMIKYANDNNIQHIIIAGDLIDSKKGSISIVRKVLNAIKKNKEITFYYVEGNHDNNIFSVDDIPENMKVFNKEFSIYDLGDIEIGGSKEINRAYKYLSFSENKFSILVLHGNVVNYDSINDEDIYLKNYINKNIDYIALGHIHKKESFTDYGFIASYSGCLEGRGFDELGEKGFYVLDIDNSLKDKKFSQKFVSLSKRSLYEIVVDIDGVTDNDSLYNRIKSKLVNYSKECLYKIILTGSYDFAAEKDLGFINQKLNEEYYFVKIYDQSRIKINYKDYENDVSLIGEFIRTVYKNEELTEEEKNKIIEYGVKALMDEL